jgi:hypothetical protein
MEHLIDDWGGGEAGFSNPPAPQFLASSNDEQLAVLAVSLAASQPEFQVRALGARDLGHERIHEFKQQVAAISHHPNRLRLLSILTPQADGAAIKAQLQLVQIVVENGQRADVIVIEPNREATVACDTLRSELLKSSNVEKRRSVQRRFRVNVVGGESEAKFHMLQIAPRANGGALKLLDPRGVRFVTWEASGHDRRWLLCDLASVFRERLDVLERLDAWSDGVIASVSIRGSIAPSQEGKPPTHADVVQFRQEMDQLFERLDPDQEVYSLSDRQHRLFRAPSRRPTLRFEWDEVPLRQKILSTVTPILYERHAAIDAARIRTNRTTKSTWQRAVLSVDVSDLEDGEVRSLIGALEALDFGGKPKFLPIGWRPAS